MAYNRNIISIALVGVRILFVASVFLAVFQALKSGEVCVQHGYMTTYDSVLECQQSWRIVAQREAFSQRCHGEAEGVIADANNWLKGCDSKIAGTFATPLHSLYGSCDAWGNQLKCCVRNFGDEPNVGFYSTGEDGESLTMGNDADDIASWRELPTSYLSKVNIIQRRKMALQFSASAASAFIFWHILGYAVER